METVATLGRGTARSNDHGLLQAFAARSQVSNRPLMAVSPHFVMGNWAAKSFLGTLDFDEALALTNAGEGSWTAVDVFEAPDPGLLLELEHEGSAEVGSSVESSDEADQLERVLPGRSRLIGNVRQAARRALRDCGHVLLSGEAGTGKSTLAAHLLAQTAGRFVSIDVDSNPDWGNRLIYALSERESVVLRHVSSLRIDDVPDVVQVLEGAIRRDLRVIMTATPCLPLRLQPLVRHSQHRLRIPPLRDRIEDIPEIVTALPTRKRVRRLDADTVRWLWSQQWPGNVRELIAATRGRSLQCTASTDIQRQHASNRRVPLTQDLQKRALQETLERCEGNRSRAALMLGVSRATLYRKIDQYDLRS